MDSSSVKPVRRWPLLPTRKAGDPATVPVSPTGNVNPAVSAAPPTATDQRPERRRKSGADHAASDDGSNTPAAESDRRIDRQI